MNVNVKAARAVALATEGNPAERLMFLSMLGLLGRDGGIAPDDARVYEIPSIEVADGVNKHRRMPR